MKCQNCGVIDASYHYRSNINGTVTEQHLCVACAQNVENPIGALADFFGGNLFVTQRPRGVFFVPFAQEMPGLTQPPPTPALEPKELEIPAEADDALKHRRQVNQLRQEMETAITAENFERAAELRDEIQRLDGKGA
ncbi:MAG: UvrB/UvrC motif-containing protein [Oscillospiraceae bacterium]|nr:UvrB/UvrC motif-containing protein [Oscillospiraceae bacterium]